MFILNISDTTGHTYQKSNSPEFDAESSDSAETVELTVSKTPPDGV